MGVIQRSDSLYNVSPCVATKPNGDYRFTLNLIPVNDQFELSALPCTLIEPVLHKAKGKKYKSILDLKDGYWQCVLPPVWRKYFAFSVIEGNEKGHYEFVGLP